VDAKVVLPDGGADTGSGPNLVVVQQSIRALELLSAAPILSL
jgi:hypothetical protein